MGATTPIRNTRTRKASGRKAMTDTAGAQPAPSIKRYFRPPVIGLLALMLTLVGNPIMHACVTATKELFGPSHEFLFYQTMGAIMVVALVWGIKRNEEVSGTLIGWVAGLLLWSAYASYAF